jgi:hypothetical protein
MSEPVTDPTVIAKLQHAGRRHITFNRRWLRTTIGQIAPKRFKVPNLGWRIMLLPHRMRFANAESITVGPFCYTRPMPWLLGPAKALHPEAFADGDITGMAGPLLERGWD